MEPPWAKKRRKSVLAQPNSQPRPAKPDRLLGATGTFGSCVPAAFAARIDPLHAAIEDRCVLRLAYRDEAGRTNEREIESLCLAFRGGAWTLDTWCRLCTDFRNFRPDRIDAVVDTDERFIERPANNLDACLAAMRSYYAGMD